MISSQSKVSDLKILVVFVEYLKILYWLTAYILKILYRLTAYNLKIYIDLQP